MSEADQIAGLETALIERARQLAEEYRINGRQQHDRLVEDAQKRLRGDEDHAITSARARAERAYQQQVQAAELELGAELDRLRLELVSAVLSHLPARLERIATDEQRYLPLLQRWMRDGAQAIEHRELLVELNARDLQRIKQGWDKLAREAAPDKHLTLVSAPIDCGGGAVVTSGDRRIRLDNTFEGRQERMSEQLQTVIAEALVPEHLRGGS